MACNVQVVEHRDMEAPKAAQDRDRGLQRAQQLVLLGLQPLIQVANSLVEKVDSESPMSPSEIKDVLARLIDCLYSVSNTHFHLTQ